MIDPTVCYVVSLPDGSEVFVRVTQNGEATVVTAAHRDESWQTWGPPLPVQVRP